MTGEPDDAGVSRRSFVRGAGTAGVAAAGAGASTPVAAQSGGVGEYLSGTSNYDGVVDRRGQSEVTVEVGVQANGGAFGFGPAAIRVDPGTTVKWKWTGEGGQHNVVHEGGDFESKLYSSAGVHFEHTFENTGVFLYFCRPHKPLGMKGAVVVGDSAGPGGGSSGGGGGQASGGPLSTGGISALEVLFGAGTALVLLTPLVLYYYRARERPEVEYEGPSGDEATAGEPEGVPEASPEEPVRELGHDEFDPVGTASLVALYLLILVVLWVFMYFVEFLGNGPTVIG